jgi:hypothetical protein
MFVRVRRIGAVRHSVQHERHDVQTRARTGWLPRFG